MNLTTTMECDLYSCFCKQIYVKYTQTKLSKRPISKLVLDREVKDRSRHTSICHVLFNNTILPNYQIILPVSQSYLNSVTLEIIEI